MPKPSETLTRKVEYRERDEYWNKLSERAEDFGMTPNEYARQIVRELLDDQVRTQTLHELMVLRMELRDLREGIATTLETVLINTTEASKENIRKWVSDNVRPQPLPQPPPTEET